MDWVVYLAASIFGYLLGATPTGYIFARVKGIDIRKHGSGNIGATNVFRILGNKSGVAVLALDGFKGWLACKIPLPLFVAIGWVPVDQVPSLKLTCAVLGGFAAVLGHIYTFWLHFRGGKGVATTAGIMLALVPTALLVSMATWLLVFLISRYVSLASIAAAISLPFAAWMTQNRFTIILIMAFIGGLAIYKHRSNLRRLLAGTEHRVNFRRRLDNATS